MTTARVFTSGNSQAVRLPKEFRVDCAKLTIFRRGKEIVLREPPRNLARAFDHSNRNATIGSRLAARRAGM
ncbi:hypothetical protein FACS189475_04870 [Betaproteobacteria bacterium]|nr:hypothetical protein FACS189475_04870 [Betaproteobacteria bacterium]